MKNRVQMVIFLVFCCLVIVVSRLFFLQVVMGGYYRGLAMGNRMDRKVVGAVRGAILDSSGERIAGNVDIDGRIVRFYPEGEVTAGVTGYVSQGRGVAGLEKQYDDSLKGKNGEVIEELDAMGRSVAVLGEKKSVTGTDLTLNLNLGLQRKVYQSLKERLKLSGGVSASVVVSRVGGEILALSSLPSFDPNLFTSSGLRGSAGGDYSSGERVLSDEKNKPLFNRVIAGRFAPGSVYKVAVAVAGLSDGVFDEKYEVNDTGEIKLGTYRFGNWYFDKYGRTDGWVNVVRALARSNDIFFYKAGEKVGIERLVYWSQKLGVGEKTGVDLPGEDAGLLPDPLWREREMGERWFLGNTYHLSIGQGDLLMTPLQVNRLASSTVSGEKCVPRLVKGKRVCNRLDIDERARKTVLDGMRGACMEGGTASAFFDMRGRVYCKTGTAQKGGKDQKSHAWINVIVPSEGGKNNLDQIKDWIVVTVQIEEGGEGSSEAGPVAREIVNYILEKRLVYSVNVRVGRA